MVVDGTINSNTKEQQHQAAALPMKTAPAMETTRPRQ